MDKKKVFIRYGHGGKDPGAVANGLVEKTLNLKVALKLATLLEGLVEIKLSTNTDIFLSLEEGIKMANDWGADIFISIHHNAGGGDGYEIYYSLKSANGKKLATCISDQYKTLQNPHGLAVKTRESEKYPGKDYYTELGTTKAVAIISEFAYLDSVDNLIVSTAAGLDKEALCLAKGICNYFGIVFSEKISISINVPVPTKVIPNIVYRIKLNGTQIGAYGLKENAINEFEGRKTAMKTGDIITMENSVSLTIEKQYKKDNPIIDIPFADNKQEVVSPIVTPPVSVVSPKKAGHSIMGIPEITIEQAESYLHIINPNAPCLAKIFKEEADTEGVRWDIAFCQSLKETNFFRFGGDVKAEQNNFSGLGAIGNKEYGLTFATPQIGIKVQIQHLKVYATTEPLNMPCIDPRFNYVQKGIAPNVEDLGNGKWASDINDYGGNIYKILEEIKKVPYEIKIGEPQGDLEITEDLITKIIKMVIKVLAKLINEK